MAPKWTLPLRIGISGTCTLLNVLTAGSIFTFPLYQPVLSEKAPNGLGLSMTQTNAVAVAAIITQYLSAPIFGNMIDKRGPGMACFTASLLFFFGYLFMSLLVLHPPATSSILALLLILSYGLVGMATAASYFASMITVSTSLPPSQVGSGIGIVCTLFGFSPTVLAEIGNRLFSITEPHPLSDNSSEEAASKLDAHGYLLFLAILLGVVNTLATMGLRVIPLKQDSPKVPELNSNSEEDRHSQPAETEPLLSSPKLDSEGEETDRKGHDTWTSFLRDPTTICFGLALLLTTGPGEMILNSIGGIIMSLLAHSSSSSPNTPSTQTKLASRQIQFLSLSNTISRLVVGFVSDRCYNRGISRLIWLIGGCLMLAATFLYGAFGLGLEEGKPGLLWVFTVGTGIGYGVCFTTVPAILRSISPPSHFGRNWGLLSYFSAAGAFIYMVLYGLVSDWVRRNEEGSLQDAEVGQCVGRRCFEPTLIIASVGCILAAGLVLGLWRGKWRGLA